MCHACASSFPACIPSPQDEKKEIVTTTELLTEAPLQDLLEEKAQSDDALKLKASLSKAASRAFQDPWDLE